MTSKTIKISKENYTWLLNMAAELQKKNEKLVSFDETISTLKENCIKKTSLSDLAGGWELTEKEAEKLKKNMGKGWGKWKIRSV